MKIYNKPCFILGFFLLALSAGGAVSGFAVLGREFVERGYFFAALFFLVWGLRIMERSVSEQSDTEAREKERQELLEANDERGRYIALKTRAAMYRIVYWLLSALTLGAMAIGLIMDDNDTKLAFMLLFFIWLGMSLLELAVRAYYRNKE